MRTAQELSEILRTDRERIAATGRKAGSALRVHDALKARPIATVQELCRRTGLSFPAAASAIETLAGLEITRELTGKRRNRIFAYERYLATLSDETGMG